jgi:hypothetical protein
MKKFQNIASLERERYVKQLAGFGVCDLRLHCRLLLRGDPSGMGEKFVRAGVAFPFLFNE